MTYLLRHPLDEPAQRPAGILTLVIVRWISEAIPIPVTAILGMALSVMLGVAPSDEIFSLFGNSTIFVFLGGFVLAESMRKHGLDRRFAFGVLSIPGVAGSTTRVVIAFGLMSAGLSAFVSNPPAPAMLMPMVAYGASVGGLLTPGRQPA